MVGSEGLQRGNSFALQLECDSEDELRQGEQKAGLDFFANYCRQHNPYVKGRKSDLLDTVNAVQKDPQKHSDPYFVVKKVISVVDMVAVHTELLSSKSNLGEGGLRQVHLFRFNRGNKIVKYWDVTQQVPQDMLNAANAF